MKISNINYTNPSLCFGQKKTKNKGNINFTHKPMQDGLNTAGAWFGFGVGLDFVSRKCNFFKSPTKNSLTINGIIGATAGIVSVVSRINKVKPENSNDFV